MNTLFNYKPLPKDGVLCASTFAKNRFPGNCLRELFTMLWIGSLAVAVPLFTSHAQSLNDSKLHARELVAGLNQPTAMAFIGSNDILVLQKNDGRVRRVIDGVLQAGQVLDLAVDTDSERGLLGIALHPNFPATSSVYLYYTESATGADTAGVPDPLGNRVYRFDWNGSALVNPTLILDLPVLPGANHDGGVIVFGPDGKLYVVIGDLNRNGKLQNFPNGPAPDDTGVILRVNDDGSIPNDNPFFSQGGNLAKYYAYGVRNSFGLAFDPVTGRLWDTENGPASYDEINLVMPGFNSGWEQIMGPDSRDPQGVGDLFTVGGAHHYSDPEFSWLNTVGPTGMVFLNSSRLGMNYENDLFVGDINNGRVYRFKMNANRDGFIFTAPTLADLVADSTAELQELILGTGFGGITDLKTGPDGNLYVLSFGLGKIFVIRGTATPVDFDGNDRSDIVVNRRGAWLFHDFATATQTGGAWTGSVPGCIPAPMDYDGDGKTDFTQRCGGAWHFYNSDGSYNKGIWTGVAAGDRAVPADYDGDGTDDVVVYRGGAWLFYDFATGLFNATKSVWTGGGAGCIPVPMDYDGDGTANFTQLCGGAWHFYNANGSYNKSIWTGGIAGDLPVPADYDGDGTEDVVVYRGGAWLFYDFATGLFNAAKSVWTGAPLHWLGGTSLPAPLDYDGDGKVDFTVYSGGPWHFYNANGSYNNGIWTGGVVSDRPISRRLLP